MMLPATHTFWIVAIFAFCALWGSFLNVVVYRMPQGLSVVRPGSACGSCQRPIPWYYNIPIVSWIMLRGRCFSCNERFSVRYPLVEAAVAALGAAVWMKLAFPFDATREAPLGELLTAWVFLFIFVADLVAIALIDLDTMRIPDVLSLSIIPIGLAAAIMVPHVTGVDLRESILGLIIGGGTLLSITWGYHALTGREGMGLGDYRLMGMVGAFLGWQSLLWLLMASAAQGILFALGARMTGLDEALPHPDEYDHAPGEFERPEGEEALRHMAVPFGPFIVLAALEWLIFEPQLRALFDALVFNPGGAPRF